MGGIGSGRGIRKNAWRSRKRKIGNLSGLIIPELIKMQKANPNKTLSFGNINLIVKESVIHLEGGVEKLHLNTIKIDAMPCNYGGYRFFAFCPVCNRRIRTLYLCKTVFACRHCLRMGYASQNQTLYERVLLKKDKVGQKINNNEWKKPKWMRKKTFTKLREQYQKLDAMIDLANLFSLRTNYSAETLQEIYVDAICVPMEVALTHYGKNWKHEEYTNTDELWPDIEKRSGGRLHKGNCF